jgi:sugar phosphate permease
MLEGVPTVLLGIICFFFLTDRPAEATWLSDPQRAWLVGRMDEEASRKKPIGHISLWQLATNKYFITMALVCAGASATGSVLSVWQPQILKALGLTNLQTGFVNSIPYGIATVLMILWGRHSDRTAERRWHTAIPLLLAAFGLASLTAANSIDLDRLCGELRPGWSLFLQGAVLGAVSRLAVGQHARRRLGRD